MWLLDLKCKSPGLKMLAWFFVAVKIKGWPVLVCTFVYSVKKNSTVANAERNVSGAVYQAGIFIKAM